MLFNTKLNVLQVLSAKIGVLFNANISQVPLNASVLTKGALLCCQHVRFGLQAQPADDNGLEQASGLLQSMDIGRETLLEADCPGEPARTVVNNVSPCLLELCLCFAPLLLGSRVLWLFE